MKTLLVIAAFTISCPWDCLGCNLMNKTVSSQTDNAESTIRLVESASVNSEKTKLMVTEPVKSETIKSEQQDG